MLARTHSSHGPVTVNTSAFSLYTTLIRIAPLAELKHECLLLISREKPRQGRPAF